jgi:hypothetical protein
MGRWLGALLVTLLTTLTAPAQPGKNIEFNLYERNPTLFLLLAVVAAVVIAAVFLLKRGKGNADG